MLSFYFFCYLCSKEDSAPALSLVPLRCERKVRAAQSTPLPKIEATGDDRVRQKKRTARKGKGEKAV